MLWGLVLVVWNFSSQFMSRLYLGLTFFRPVFPLCISWKQQKMRGFFVFGVMQVENWRHWSSHRRFSFKKVFLKISQNSQQNTFAGIFFSIKLQAKAFPVNFAKFLTAPFYRTPPVVASAFRKSCCNYQS